MNEPGSLEKHGFIHMANFFLIQFVFQWNFDILQRCQIPKLMNCTFRSLIQPLKPA